MTEFQPGRTLAQYRLIEKIGEGGMGVVWKAEDTSLGRLVAIKVLPREFTADPERRQRFRREARSAASLNHPNITVIHEIAEEETTLFIVMELVEGKSLRERICEGPLPAAELLPLAATLAEALAFAHSRGVIHRDLKPDNIMLTAAGQVKLLDFGLAKLLRPEESGPDEKSVKETISAELTRQGSFTGTVAYMSPEMARGRSVESQADQFSLGIMLYEMAAGARPFQGENWASVMAKILEVEPRPLRGLRPEISPELERIVHRCLKKNPEERFPDTGDLARRLRTLASGASGEAARATRPGKSTLRWIALGVALLIVILAILFTFRRERAASTTPPVPPTALASTPEAGLPATQTSAIAVLPFVFHGDPQYAYLGEGMVNLLGTVLDGAGELRSVDTRAILGTIQREKLGTPSDPGTARVIAGRLGAARFILGDIVEAGGRFRIQASLYGASDIGQVEGSAEAEGKADQLFEMVDNLAAQILAAQPGGLSKRVTQVAAVTTHSIPALKAYMEGESQFRAGRFTQAAEALQRAVAADPSFALAYYRLSIAAEYSLNSALTRQAAELAVRHSQHLANHDRLDLEALLASRRGDPAEAELRYRSILAQYPNDVEAWFELGEIFFHLNPLRGRPFAESREPFEKVIALEPDHAPALLHLGRIAALAGDRQALSAYEGRALKISPTGERALEARGLLAYGLADRAAQERLLQEAHSAPDTDAIVGSNITAAYSGDIAGAANLVRILTDPIRVPQTQAMGHLWLAYLEVACGRPSAAEEELAKAHNLNPARALVGRASLALVPLVPSPHAQLASLEVDLSRFDAASVQDLASGNVWIDSNDRLYVLLRLYLLGSVDTHLGRYDKALASAAQLERMIFPVPDKTLPAALARSLRASVALARSQAREALSLLEGPVLDTPADRTYTSPFFSRPQDRFTRGEALAALGRDEEALDWFATIEGAPLYDLPYAGPALLRRAQMSEKLGRNAEAARYYQRLLDLWSDAEPALDPLRDEAREALSRLKK